MGITDKLNSKLAKAYDTKLADAIKPFECVRTTAAGEYDPVTGTTPIVTSGYTGRGVFGSFKQEEIDGTRILATDTKLSAALKIETVEVVDGEPTGNLAIPQVDDVINGMTVKSVSADPADVQWVLALRRT
ncbi:hypothetical protein [Vreelandella populi]|uniref:hypothetical protein n=1 Tax=Vreelandella populi TaxID=2498858 RepID=UPI000F8D9787|nr:hypothetical protein [Halomonas populi]RUR38548.1 hypothetical protein ELY25_09300 [Halomonas populi]